VDLTTYQCHVCIYSSDELVTHPAFCNDKLRLSTNPPVSGSPISLQAGEDSRTRYLIIRTGHNAYYLGDAKRSPSGHRRVTPPERGSSGVCGELPLERFLVRFTGGHDTVLVCRKCSADRITHPCRIPDQYMPVWLNDKNVKSKLGANPAATVQTRGLH